MSRHKMAMGFGAAALLLSFAGATGWAQQGTMVSIDQYTQDRLSSGTTAEKTYFQNKEDALTRTIDLGQYIQRDPETQQEQQVTIMVRTGQRIFCAHCGAMLKDTVHFTQVGIEESVRFYDDGTHGDLVPDDGLPTYIEDVRDDFIGPWCYQHMLLLENIRDRAKYKDAYSAKLLFREPMEEEEPQSFYSMVKVAPFDKESRLDYDTEAKLMPGTPGLEDRFSFWALDEKRRETIDDFEEGVIYEFKRADTHLDYWLHRNEVKPFVPQMLDQLVAAGSIPTGRYRRAVPGQPVNRWQQLQRDARAIPPRY